MSTGATTSRRQALPAAAWSVAGMLVVAAVHAAAVEEYEVECDADLLKVSIGDGIPKTGGHWTDQHESFTQAAEAKAAELQLVVYGDSITEHLGEMPDQLETYRDSYVTEAFGIGGDRTQTLLYRMQNGEWAPEMSPQFVVIMIGINNILHAFDAEGGELSKAQEEEIASEIASVIEQMAAFVQKQSCRTQILLHALLPTAWEVDNEWPNKYTPAVEDRNEQVKDLAMKYKNVHYMDCMGLFLEDTDDGERIRADRMPDLLHPGEEGHEEMAKCVTEHAGQVLKAIIEEAMVVQFGDWGECSKKCGGGVKTRKSSCGINTDFTSGLDLTMTTELLKEVCSDMEVDPMDLITVCNTAPCPSPTAPPAPDAPAAPPTPEAPATPPAPEAPDSPPTPEAPDSPPFPEAPDLPSALQLETVSPPPEPTESDKETMVPAEEVEPDDGPVLQSPPPPILPQETDMTGDLGALPALENISPTPGLPPLYPLPPATPQLPPLYAPKPPGPASPPPPVAAGSDVTDSSEGDAIWEPQAEEGSPSPQLWSTLNPWVVNEIDPEMAGSHPYIASPIGNISSEFAAGNYDDLPVPVPGGSSSSPEGAAPYMVAAVIAIGACGVLSLAGALIFYACLMHKMHKTAGERMDGFGKGSLRADEASDQWHRASEEGMATFELGISSHST